MELQNRIPLHIYLVLSLIFITTAIAILFFGKFVFATVSLVMGLISLVAWTFLGLFEENTKN